jgi:uncharacterized membrane protein
MFLSKQLFLNSSSLFTIYLFPVFTNFIGKNMTTVQNLHSTANEYFFKVCSTFFGWT